MSDSLLKKLNNRKGFTLVRLIITVILITTLLTLGIIKIKPVVINRIQYMKEYNIQVAIKKAIYQIDQTIEYSNQIELLPKVFVKDAGKMNRNLNYLMVSHDGRRLVIMEHDGKEFNEKTIVQERKNVEYEIFFEKQDNNRIHYIMSAYIINIKEGTKRKLVFESTVEPINIPQIFDKGTGIPKNDLQFNTPNIALAYR